MKIVAYAGRYRRRSRDSGFTLIELLVVVSIIGLLIALLMPALRQARSAAKDANCLSNIRQANAAELTYTGDYKDYCTPWATPADRTGPAPWGAGKFVAKDIDTASWLDPIWRDYLNSSIQTLECPLQTVPRPTGTIGSYIGLHGPRTNWPGYMINRSVLGLNYLPIRTADFQNPSRKVLIADAGLRINGGGSYPNIDKRGWGAISGWFILNAQAGWSGMGPADRHRSGPTSYTTIFPGDKPDGGSQFAYFDGHARYDEWASMFPWAATNIDSAAFNAGNTIFRTHWDPDGNGVQSAP